MQETTMSGPAGSGPGTAESPSVPYPLDDSEKGVAAVAYILTWITGLIIFLVVKKEQRYARWNAIQAIGLGIAVVILYVALGILGTMLAFGGGGGFGALFGLQTILGLLTIVLVIVLAVKAYQGHPVRLPVIADFADKNA